MSEEELEAIEHYKLFEDAIKQTISKGDSELYIDGLGKALKDTKVILNLIEKQQKEIENIKLYAEWHISHITEDIKDYIDDDKKGNADIIGELKEEREHWKDIIRITKNEKTYIDYKD